jgi:hypothetical protein
MQCRPRTRVCVKESTKNYMITLAKVWSTMREEQEVSLNKSGGWIITVQVSLEPLCQMTTTKFEETT